MAGKITSPVFRAMKQENRKIVVLTAYDALEASWADEAGVDAILVGDSVASTKLGFSNTVGADMDMMVHHVRSVAKAKPKALIIADLPFGSYQASPHEAFHSAEKLMRAGAEAVKLEGVYPESIQLMVKAGIPVMGHLGMTPQSVYGLGGHKVQGSGDAGAHLLQEARDLEASGVFSFVLELVVADVSAAITKEVSVPTIGIGAGAGCDGQVQVIVDLLGLGTRSFKHAKAYLNGRELITNAIREYASEVRDGTFPTSENAF